MKKFWFILLLLLCSAQAKATTGDTIYKACVNSGTNFDAGWCVGYLSSHIDAEQAAAELGKRPPRFCLPSNTSMIHVREAVMKHLVSHLDKRRLNAPAVVDAALVEAYSCG